MIIARAWMRNIVAAILLSLFPVTARADVLGEYSFLHVTFHSVWHLFLFIFSLVMIPFVLLIVSFWRFRNAEPDEHSRTTDASAHAEVAAGDDPEK